MKKTLWTIIIIAVVLVGIWLWRTRGEPTVQVSPTPGVSQDSTTQIQQDLEQIDLGDINKEFETIDADLQGL